MKQFGNEHQYIVYTDNPKFVSSRIDAGVDVRSFPSSEEVKFCIPAVATWMKWCPAARLDINQTEFLIDSDIFLLKYPQEIMLFLNNKKMKFAVMDEYYGQPFQHGAMRRKSSARTPFINAGLFIQKSGSDISDDLVSELNWWQKNVKKEEQSHHDEQGALAIALEKYLTNNELFILPKDKYVIISETSNAGIEKLDDITLFHATYPTHPAFYKFKRILDQILLNI